MRPWIRLSPLEQINVEYLLLAKSLEGERNLYKRVLKQNLGEIEILSLYGFDERRLSAMKKHIWFISLLETLSFLFWVLFANAIRVYLVKKILQAEQEARE